MAELTPYILVEESIIRSELTPYVLAGESIVSAGVCPIVIAAHERVSAGIKPYAIAVFEESGEEQIEFSTGRSVVIGCEISLPVKMNIVCTDTVNADTLVSGVESVKMSFLANRHIYAIDEILADTMRTMASGTVSESVSAITCREVNRSDVSTFDTLVRTYKEDVILFDTSR